jgi:hypothetical protein
MLAPDAISAGPSEATAGSRWRSALPSTLAIRWQTVPWEHPLGRNASQNSRLEGWGGLDSNLRPTDYEFDTERFNDQVEAEL